jgi:hypothetical protein
MGYWQAEEPPANSLHPSVFAATGKRYLLNNLGDVGQIANLPYMLLPGF